MFAGRAFLYAVPDSLVDRTYPMDRTSVTRPEALATALLGLLLALATPSGFAQFDPARALREPEAIARQFPDPDVHYPTPGLREGRTDFPTHAEVLAYLDELAKASAGSNQRMSVKIIGQSQQGRPMPLVVLSNNAGARDPSRPTILILGQQHGNEPAGGETALVLAQQLAGPRADLLDKVNVLIVPRSPNSPSVNSSARCMRCSRKTGSPALRITRHRPIRRTRSCRWAACSPTPAAT